jgi:uncharacterized protein (DUF1015 family)
MNFLHVVRPEIDLPEGTASDSSEAYQKAAENLNALQKQDYLVQDEAPAVYVYRLVMGKHTQVGVVTLCRVDEYDQGLIKKHEHTRQKPEDDRTRHIQTLGAQTGPVFLTYRDQAAIDNQVAGIVETDPLYDFTAQDGIRHTIWQVKDPAQLVDAFEAVPCAYIADGHHRAAAAARYAREAREAGEANEESDWFLTVLFPAGQLQILPYNRAVKDLNGMTSEQFREKLAAEFEIVDGVEAAPAEPGRIAMYLDGQWSELRWKPDPDADVVGAMDVSVLQNRVLDAMLGIQNPRKDARLACVGGIRGTQDLERRVDSGEAAVAFSFYPTSVEQLMAVSDAEKVMPPKSTWFEPKLRSGLFVHLLK